MTRVGNLSEVALWKLGDEFARCLRREKKAVGAANEQSRASDVLGVGPRSGRQSEPARIELVAEAPVGLGADRMLRDVSAEGLTRVAGLWQEAEAIDGFVAAAVGPSQRKRESGSSSGSLRTAPREIDEGE